MTGFILCGIAAVIFYLDYQFFSKATKTQGTVVEVREVGSDTVTYAPLVRFQDDRGEWVIHTPSWSTGSPLYQVT